MSPELETLDQLLGGDMSLEIIRGLYPDDPAFMKGIEGLLSCGDILLLDHDGTAVPQWRWRRMFADGTIMDQLGQFTASLTDQGAKRIG